MTTAQKLPYGFLSMLYALFFGVALVFPTIAVIGVLTQDPDPMFPSIQLVGVSVIIWAAPIIALQIASIALSNSRSELPTPEPMEVSFWNWQTNVHFYGMAIVFIGMVVFLGLTFLAR